MWSEEDEEKYLDLKIIDSYLLPKRTVKGDLKNDTYIEEKKVEFKLMSFFDNKIKMYLPVSREEKHFGEDIMYFNKMGEYKEYISEDENFVFTIEKCDYNFGVEEIDEEFDDVYEYCIDEIAMKYFETEVIYWTDFNIEKYGLNVYVIRALAYVQDEASESLIYFISGNEGYYRFYIGTYKKKIEILDVLGQKIVESIVCK